MKDDFYAADGEDSVLFPVTFLVIFLLVCFPIDFSRADIYRYINSEGILHYTNIPTSSDYILYIREESMGISADAVLQTYDVIIQKAQAEYGVEFSLIKAVIQTESGFNRRAVSKKGAKGLMQIMPDNYETLSVSDPFDPLQNIMGGTRYLKHLLNRYDDKLPLALAAYNAGPEAVDKYGRIPPYKETMTYVQKVIILYNRYKNF
ncbi:MAG: lytic transglycosylase domain-containing protein [Desulfobacteraceae bacterium]|nr:lytic transglycosylase domain-containing protein [Desulfobacteraceae bacterium]